ncbi:hypothetical protein [Salinisphaera sp. G21_0]|uniref:hypothetical protein n=1 Tax=Salinisphaera sp. G21_0 TaxID=2821094 RepID=UPI001ADBE0E9|nr:hypothetical protein [Salinisphaera sp. G21_0]MBO9483858.1 hypothetical protein [Salinisphaera sp. G21_0]
MINTGVESGSCFLRHRSPCAGGEWRDTGGAFGRKITLKTGVEAQAAVKEIEVQSDIETELFSKKIIYRTVDRLQGQKIKPAFRDKLDEFKKDLHVFDDNLADLVGNKLRPFRITMMPNEDNGKKYKEAMKAAVDDVIADIRGTYEEWVVEGLETVSSDIDELDSYFFALMLQRIDEGRQSLPDEDSFFVNPELIDKYPEKYQIQRIGMQVSQWLFGVGIVWASSYSPGYRGAMQMDKGDTSRLFDSLIGTAMRRYNISQDEAVTRILSRPEFVTSLNDGDEPKFDGSILGNFEGGGKVLYMSAIALANRFHLSEYAGMATAMFLVRVKRAVCSMPECFSQVFYRHVGR